MGPIAGEDGSAAMDGKMPRVRAITRGIKSVARYRIGAAQLLAGPPSLCVSFFIAK